MLKAVNNKFQIEDCRSILKAPCSMNKLESITEAPCLMNKLQSKTKKGEIEAIQIIPVCQR